MSNILKRLSSASQGKTGSNPIPAPTMTDVINRTIISPEQSSNGSTSILTPDVIFEGEIESKAPITIFGTVKGSISTSSSLTLEEGAAISAEINTKFLVVRGKFDGTIHAEENVHLLANAEISGNIHAKSLKVEDGVTFIGKAQISKK